MCCSNIKKSLNDSLNRLKKTQTVCRAGIAKEYEGIVTEKPSTWIVPLWYTQETQISILRIYSYRQYNVNMWTPQGIKTWG